MNSSLIIIISIHPDSDPFFQVFSSSWLTDDSILMGTKSNDLLLYNINSKIVDYIPKISSTVSHKFEKNNQANYKGGIHSIVTNPSKSLLCTNGVNNCDIAIYKLPTVDPFCIGECAHTDFIFDTCWLDDQFLISISRDNSLALWKIDDYLENNATYWQNRISEDKMYRNSEPFENSFTEDTGNYRKLSTDLEDDSYYGCVENLMSVNRIKPLVKKSCKSSDRLRALVFNNKSEEAAVLSFDASLHIFDVVTLKQVISQKLEQRMENVCLAVNENCSLYAIGSKTHATLIDPRTLRTAFKVSLNF